QAVTFFGTFPEGLTVCLNCSEVIPAHHSDANAVCVAQCQDLLDNNDTPSSDSLTYCKAHAQVATNFPVDSCFPGACSVGGTPIAFVDPRRTPEPVEWTDRIGTDQNPADALNDLRRSAATTL